MYIDLNVYTPGIYEPECLYEILETELTKIEKEEKRNIEIIASIVSMVIVRSSGYGTWETRIKLEINGKQISIKQVHHDEEWYQAEKIVYDASMADSDEEWENAHKMYQQAFCSCIEANENQIIDALYKSFE